MGLFNFLFGTTDASDAHEPSVNIDGSPMCGGIDINGNPFGVTSSDTNLEHSSCFDDCSSSFDDSSCGGFDDW